MFDIFQRHTEKCLPLTVKTVLTLVIHKDKTKKSMNTLYLSNYQEYANIMASQKSGQSLVGFCLGLCRIWILMPDAGYFNFQFAGYRINPASLPDIRPDIDLFSLKFFSKFFCDF